MFIKLQNFVNGSKKRMTGYIHPQTLKDVYVGIEPLSYAQTDRSNARLELNCDETAEGLLKAKELLDALVSEVESRIRAGNFKP